MSGNALSSLSHSLLGIVSLHRFLPTLIFSRPSSSFIYGLGATTFLCGLGIKLYSTYRDIRFIWLEHRVEAFVEATEKLQTEHNRLQAKIDEAINRGQRMVALAQRRDAEAEELSRMLTFLEMPVACAARDDADPQFEEYDCFVQRLETMMKIETYKVMDEHANEEINWWKTVGERTAKALINERDHQIVNGLKTIDVEATRLGHELANPT
ncbi:hypothetical protein BDP27DRAFT_1430744 [Rhodocollybia butyracea]|uniref:Uncharacterized protein n=1 Tax=Rhodocollybia butyracea TaxID=206335 RepID=A0A9P5TZ07_9AGAR|nr:hypothetical protein BDP27DRAFT_1430744 [Rhodocollybia butyracea]